MSNDIYKHNMAMLGKLITKKRKRLNISLTNLAKLAAVDKATISRLESGKRTVGIETLERIILAIDFYRKLLNKSKRLKKSGDTEMAEDMLIIRPLFILRPKGVKSDTDLSRPICSNLTIIHPYAKDSINISSLYIDRQQRRKSRRK